MAQDVLRYSRVENLLRLALLMQGSSEGVSLQNIQDEFEVSRRTAERMKDAIIRIFPQTEELKQVGNIKTWHIPYGSLNHLLSFSPEEISTLENAISILQRDNLLEQSKELKSVSEKLSALIKPKEKIRLETDVEALVESEGLAMRAGARPKVKTDFILKIRDAIKSCKKIEINYLGRKTQKESIKKLQPYGFIYGNRHYLLALDEVNNDFRYYALGNINKIDLLDESFEREKNFDIKEWAKNSFGVFQESVENIELIFDKAVALDVKDFLFHPTQVIEDLDSGEVKVSFRAGGIKEICWHLFTWEDKVKILSPTKLKVYYKNLLTSSFNNC